MKCGTYNVFDRFEGTAAGGGPNMCAQIFVPDLAPLILERSQWYFADTYYGWSRSAVQNFSLIAQYSANWWPFWIKKIPFLHFSPNLFWLIQRKLVGILLGVRGTLSGNMTSNGLDLGKWQPMCECVRSKLHTYTTFLLRHFSTFYSDRFHFKS